MKYEEVIGDGVAVTYNVTHGLGTEAVMIATSSPAVSAVPTDQDTVQIVFAVAPATESVTVVVIG